MKPRLALLATVVALTAGATNVQAQDQSLPATPYMGGPVELVTAPNGAIANKRILDGIDEVAWAESDHMTRANMKMVDADFGMFTHLREPTTPDSQPVIRMNQDTLYSGIVLDLSKPATITPGWNYAVRIYQPREEILDGSWTFPDIVQAR